MVTKLTDKPLSSKVIEYNTDGMDNLFLAEDVASAVEEFDEAMRDIRPNDSLESYTFRLRKRRMEIFGSFE